MISVRKYLLVPGVTVAMLSASVPTSLGAHCCHPTVSYAASHVSVGPFVPDDTQQDRLAAHRVSRSQVRYPLPGKAVHKAAPVHKFSAIWDRLASCESTNNWHINTGNGFYGGLQFMQGTWKSFGGLKFAKRADLASKQDQITVAIRIQKVQGWKAWPVCSRKIGVRQ